MYSRLQSRICLHARYVNHVGIRDSILISVIQLDCTLTIISKSTCQLTDIDCIKGNEKLLDDLTKCVRASCKPKEALSGFLSSLSHRIVY